MTEHKKAPRHRAATLVMTKRFEVGDRVSWNSEAGRVSGTIVEIHTQDVDYKGIRIARARSLHNTRSRAARPTTSPCTAARCSPD